MKVRDFIVKPVELSVVKEFIEKNHYSGSINGVRATYAFALLWEGRLLGAMLYGGFGMASVWKKYGDNEDEVIELRRLCCVDDTPKNTESFFIGATLRWLKKNTNIKTVVSYADNHYGHKGVIYKASNFAYVGETKPSRVIVVNDRTYHDKAIRTKYKGKLKPFAQRIKDKLDNGEAFYEDRPPKNIYIYKINR